MWRTVLAFDNPESIQWEHALMSMEVGEEVSILADLRIHRVSFYMFALEDHSRDKLVEYFDSPERIKYLASLLAYEVGSPEQNGIRISTIHKEHGDYVIRSKKGKPLGKYKTKSKAKKRLRQIEYFKRHPH